MVETTDSLIRERARPSCPLVLCREDAQAAMDNMHNSELYGRVLRVNYAQPMKIKGGEMGFATQPGDIITKHPFEHPFRRRNL